MQRDHVHCSGGHKKLHIVRTADGLFRKQGADSGFRLAQVASTPTSKMTLELRSETINTASTTSAPTVHNRFHELV